MAVTLPLTHPIVPMYSRIKDIQEHTFMWDPLQDRMWWEKYSILRCEFYEQINLNQALNFTLIYKINRILIIQFPQNNLSGKHSESEFSRNAQEHSFKKKIIRKKISMSLCCFSCCRAWFTTTLFQFYTNVTPFTGIKPESYAGKTDPRHLTIVSKHWY